MSDEPRFPPVRPPRQQRSRETLDRILHAAEALLETRPFAEISIEEVLLEADVSRSSFYARLPHKDALLPELLQRYIERARETLSDTIATSQQSGSRELLVEQLLFAYLGFIRRFYQPTSSFEEAELTSTLATFRSEVVRVVVRIFGENVGRLGDRDFARRVEFAARASGAIILRAACPPAQFARQIGFDDATLVREVAVMALGYLDAERG